VTGDETYADLERVRREITTLRHRMEFEENPDLLDPTQQRLEALEAEEHELVRQLESPAEDVSTARPRRRVRQKA
jgi:hypothetical protein